MLKASTIDWVAGLKYACWHRHKDVVQLMMIDISLPKD